MFSINKCIAIDSFLIQIKLNYWINSTHSDARIATPIDALDEREKKRENDESGKWRRRRKRRKRRIFILFILFGRDDVALTPYGDVLRYSRHTHRSLSIRQRWARGRKSTAESTGPSPSCKALYLGQVLTLCYCISIILYCIELNW